MYFGGAYYCPVCDSRPRTFVPLIEKDYVAVGKSSAYFNLSQFKKYGLKDCIIFSAKSLFCN